MREESSRSKDINAIVGIIHRGGRRGCIRNNRTKMTILPRHEGARGGGKLRIPIPPDFVASM